MSSCFFNGYFGRNINCKFNLISLYRKKPGAGITIEPGGYGYRKEYVDVVLYSFICSCSGTECRDDQSGADVSNGLPMFHMVGYLSSEVKEASERVRTAIRNSGMKLPAKKIIVNLAPATVRKRGASFDLPIALAFWQQ